MKRNIPLLLAIAAGFVMIVAFFIPATLTWGEKVSIWFDVLASIAFILGGGNLLKVHLKKVSDKASGWGYSVITVLAFLGGGRRAQLRAEHRRRRILLGP